MSLGDRGAERSGKKRRNDGLADLEAPPHCHASSMFATVFTPWNSQPDSAAVELLFHGLLYSGVILLRILKHDFF